MVGDPPILPRLLVVESDTQVVRAIRRVLDERVEVLAAPDGAEAIRLLVCQGADVILAEVAVSVPGGESFVEWLERSMPTWLPRLLVCSGGQRAEVAEGFWRRHGLPTLFKPYDIEALVGLITERAESPPPRVSPFERTMASWGTGSQRK